MQNVIFCVFLIFFAICKSEKLNNYLNNYYIIWDVDRILFEAICSEKGRNNAHLEHIICFIRGKSPLDLWSIDNNTWCPLVITQANDNTKCFSYSYPVDGISADYRNGIAYNEITDEVEYRLIKEHGIYSFLNEGFFNHKNVSPVKYKNDIANEICQYNKYASFMELPESAIDQPIPGMEDYWKSCINFNYDICRIHKTFGTSLQLLYDSNLTGVLAIDDWYHTYVNQVDKQIEYDFGITLEIPTSSELTTLITNTMFSNMEQYTKNILLMLEDQLYYRECILINEFEEMLVDTSIIVLDGYNLVQDHIIQTMGGYYHLASLMRSNLNVILNDIKSKDISEMSREVNKWYDIINNMDRLLKVPLRNLMDRLNYEVFQHMGNDLVAAWEEWTLQYSPTSPQILDKVEWNSEVGKIQTNLVTLLRIGLKKNSTYGSAYTERYFKSVQDAFKLK
ncbi:hypothetical protein BdWA1_000684 [Babesia duncani]|uniref:Uncharacterized protein n=1 Tax=Babesia duncani TaxID=323732 RepID=A0AAD9UQ61_9APIC|nr:hypothetical protein BdWA1_000684 [Babesia duncani]